MEATLSISKGKKKEKSLKESTFYQDFKDTLQNAKRILLSTHKLPDGDGLGAEAALFHYLKRARKACRVYNPDPLPKRYGFLDPKENILMGPGQIELWDTCDLWIIVDTNDPRRIGEEMWGDLVLRSKKIIFLDHHTAIPELVEQNKYPPHCQVLADTQSGSIGEMLYEIFNDLQYTKINKDVAQGLYTSVMTDTNSFRYARTTPLSHRIAAEMIELGVNPEEIYQNIYSSKEVSHIKLLGHTLMNVKTTEDGRVAWLEMPLDLRQEYRASSDDTQSFLNLLLLLKDADIVCLFREEGDGEVRISMRSKGKAAINTVAMEFGGGGHEFAAGMAIGTSLDKAVESVISALKKALDQFDRFGK